VAADYGPHIGKTGWQDWNIVPFALENNYIVATNNRRHFLKEYLKYSLHGGLIIVVPNLDRADQIRLFSKVLDETIVLGDNIVNKIVEILEDGAVHVMEMDTR
jgi:hypothetical protein